MNAEELSAIEARADAATPGPWIVSADFSEVIAPCPCCGRICVCDCFGVPGHADCYNSDFIAHAREDIPALLAKVRSQGEEIERLRGLLVESSARFEFYGHGPNMMHPNFHGRALDMVRRIAAALSPKPSGEASDE